MLPLPLFLASVIVVGTASAFSVASGARGETRCCLAAATNDNVGLLHGIENVTTADYYASELQMDDLEWLLKPGVFWEAATKDAEALNLSTDDYLQNLIEALKEFKMSDKVHDREEFFGFLETIGDGKLLLVLGGKSVGKSLVLAEFEKKLRKDSDYLPLRVNGRTIAGSPLSVGILEAYKKMFADSVNFDWGSFVELIKRLATTFAEEAVARFEPLRKLFSNVDPATRQNIFESGFDFLIESRKVSEKSALESLVKLAEKDKKRPVLIIDEANKLLGLGHGREGTTSTLSQIVQLTKETKRMEVIMACSEFAYPYLLEDNGLNLADITATLIAGEIPPRSMWELLVVKKDDKDKPLIGMGENLARLLMASHGGHFLLVLEAVESLSSKKERFAARTCLSRVGQNITMILDSHPSKGLQLLRNMAEYGFVPVGQAREPEVEAIVRSNIGGIVMEDATVVGLPESKLLITGCVLVPSSENIRNRIAIEVNLHERRLHERHRLEQRWWKRFVPWFRK